MKRALVTGINGMDGSHLADFLLKNNYEDTKQLVVELTYRLDSIEEKYNKLNSELKKRVK